VLDIVQACYDKPYATITEDPRVSLTKIEDAVHTRTVLFARPDYFVILDHVAGQGEHTCESLLHFAPIKVSLEADGAVTATGENGAVLHALPVLKDGLYAETICGSTDPMQGWVVCMRKGKRIPVEAPTVIHRKTGALPQSFATVLYPQLAADAPAPKCTLINQDDAGISFTVAAENRTDEWHVAFDKEYAYAENGTEWAGKALLISTRSGGARKVAAVNAKRLALPGEVLVDGFTAFAEW
jgi:hypothetical protein